MEGSSEDDRGSSVEVEVEVEGRRTLVLEDNESSSPLVLRRRRTLSDPLWELWQQPDHSGQ